jgi:hypothetical protein
MPADWTRLPEGVPIRLREQPDDLLARPDPAEAIKETLAAQQPTDEQLRPLEPLQGPGLAQR